MSFPSSHDAHGGQSRDSTWESRDGNCFASKFDRVVVLGTSGAGKTTFARALAQRLSARHVELDALHWEKNWTPREADSFRAAVDVATAHPRWVVDGNYHQVRDLVWTRATAAVWLNYGFPIVFAQALRRTVQRIVSGEVIHNGNRETFSGAFLSADGIPIWVLRTYWRRRRGYAQLLASPEYAHLHVEIFFRPRDADSFLATVTSNRLA